METVSKLYSIISTIYQIYPRGVYTKGETPIKSPRTPTGEHSHWGGKSPMESPVHPLVEGDGDKVEKPFPMAAPDDPPFFTEAWFVFFQGF